jgi:hypothetical protein
VFVSFSPLLSLYKKDCSFVKASWTKTTMLFFETGPTRLFLPESLRRGKRIGPQIDTGPDSTVRLLQRAGANTCYLCSRMQPPDVTFNESLKKRFVKYVHEKIFPDGISELLNTACVNVVTTEKTVWWYFVQPLSPPLSEG